MDLRVEGLSFSYQNQKVLEDISFTVNSGKTASILGPNGTGKTTLLKCMSSILEADAGYSFAGNKSIQSMSLEERSKIMAYVPQFTGSNFSISVIDTIMMGKFTTSKRSVSKKDKEDVFQIIEKMRLQKFAFKDINRLSGGERQSVFIARALAQNPQILLLDEPTSDLDIKSQIFILSLIKSISLEKNITVIMVNHDLNLAEMYSDFLICLKEKNIFVSGAPRDVLTSANINSIYGIRPRVVKDDLGTYIRLMKNREDKDSFAFSSF